MGDLLCAWQPRRLTPPLRWACGGATRAALHATVGLSANAEQGKGHRRSVASRAGRGAHKDNGTHAGDVSDAQAADKHTDMGQICVRAS